MAMKQYRLASLLALLMALVSSVPFSSASPSGSFGNNRPTVLKNIAFNLAVDLSYSSDSTGLRAAEAVYAQACVVGRHIDRRVQCHDRRRGTPSCRHRDFRPRDSTDRKPACQRAP